MKKGEKMPEEQRLRLIKWLTGRKRSPQAIINSANAHRGLKRSQETKRKISESNKGREKSEEHKKKLKESFTLERRLKAKLIRQGDKSHLWKGGVSTPNEILRKSGEYILWRTAVFERDKYMCIWGGKEHGNKLHADHIKPFALYPELRFAIDNGRTLCENCHKTTDTYGGKILKYEK